MLESTSENLQTLKQAQPASLDNRSVERVIRVNTTLRDDLWLYEKQLKIWQTGLMTKQQESEIRRLQNQLVKLRYSRECDTKSFQQLLNLFFDLT